MIDFHLGLHATRFIKRIALATILFVAPIAAASAQGLGFLNGLIVGTLFGGSDQHGVAAATILYMAEDKVLQTVDPWSVRQVSKKVCFDEGDKGRSIIELFVLLTSDMPTKQRTLLQVARIFDPSNVQCAAIWFAYTEKDGTK